MKPKIYTFTLIVSMLLSLNIKAQEPVRVYTFGNEVKCCDPDGSAISYDDIADSSFISKEELAKIRLFEGKVFFKGDGVQKSVLVDFNLNGATLLGKQDLFAREFKRIAIGSKIIFQKCVFINADGTRTDKRIKVLILR